MWDLQKEDREERVFLFLGGEREERMRPVTCGSHPQPIYLRFIISLISITSHTSSPPFHLLIKVLQLLWARGKQRGRRNDKERESGRERGGGCVDRPTMAMENVIDLRGNNASESRIYIYLSSHVFPENLLSSVSTPEMFQKVSESPPRVLAGEGG